MCPGVSSHAVFRIFIKFGKGASVLRENLARKSNASLKTAGVLTITEVFTEGSG